MKENPWDLFEQKQTVDWETVNHEKLGNIDWSVLETRKFRAYFQAGSEPFVRDCAEQLGNIFTFMQCYFSNHNIRGKLSVIASPNAEVHRKIQKMLGVKNISDGPRIGEPSDHVSEIFINAENWDRNTLHILMHEATHIFYYRSGYKGNHRNWGFVGEHLAWFFQGNIESRGKYRVGEKVQSMQKKLMLKYLKEHPGFSLEDLKEGVPDPPAFEDREEGWGKGEIIVVFYSFLEEKYEHQKFLEFLTLMLDNEDIDIGTAIRRIYNRELNALDGEWREYLHLSSLTLEDDQRRTLLDKAEGSFKDGSYTEAIEAYQEIYDRYPDWNHAEHALMMIGLCYGQLGQSKRAIEFLEKSVREYPDLVGFTVSTYFYLGSAYARAGQKEKTLKALEECVHLCEALDKDPDKFPYKNARDLIKELEEEN